MDFGLESIVLLRFELSHDGNRLISSLQSLSSFLVGCGSQIYAVHAEDLISSPEFSAKVGRSSRQNKWNKYAFTIFAADNVKTQATASFLENDSAHFPENTKGEQN